MLRLKTSLLVKSKIRFLPEKKIGQFFTSSHMPLCHELELSSWLPDIPRLDPWFLYFKKRNKVMKGPPKQKSGGPKCCLLYFLKHKIWNARKPCWFILMISNVHKLNHRRSASLCKVNNPQGPFFYSTSFYGGHAWPCSNSQMVSANNEYYGPCDSAQLAIAVLVHLWCIPHGRFVAGPRSFRGIAWPASRIS